MSAIKYLVALTILGAAPGVPALPNAPVLAKISSVADAVTSRDVHFVSAIHRYCASIRSQRKYALCMDRELRKRGRIDFIVVAQ